MVTGRFAPTPSGRMHLGNILCAMLAWLSARSQGGRFLLRIEDVDVPRCPKAAGEACIEDLRWLGFDWEGTVIWQRDRTAAYEAVIANLTAAGQTYPCFCTRAELHPENAPNLGDTQVVYPGTCARLTPEEVRIRLRQRNPAIRLRVPDEEIIFTDRLQGIIAENLKRDCGDFVLRRSDGLFGYQLAAVTDDAESGVTEVVRGRDILSATPRQIYLLRLLDSPAPVYAHIPLLTDASGRRLAKRNRDLGLPALSKRYKPEALIGMLAQACGLRESAAPTSLRELADEFDWARIRREDFRLPDL